MTEINGEHHTDDLVMPSTTQSDSMSTAPEEPDEFMSSDSNSTSSSSDCSSPPASCISALTFSDSSVDVDTFLGPESEPYLPSIYTYKLVGDNIDKNVTPRHMTIDSQTRSLHYFHVYGVRDRIDLSSYSNDRQVPDVSSIHLHNLLPTKD